MLRCHDFLTYISKAYKKTPHGRWRLLQAGQARRFRLQSVEEDFHCMTGLNEQILFPNQYLSHRVQLFVPVMSVSLHTVRPMEV
jgi:hypothetical protein